MTEQNKNKSRRVIAMGMLHVVVSGSDDCCCAALCFCIPLYPGCKLISRCRNDRAGNTRPDRGHQNRTFLCVC